MKIHLFIFIFVLKIRSGSSEENQEDEQPKKKVSHQYSYYQHNPLMNPYMPFLMGQMQQPLTSNAKIEKSTLPPYDKKLTVEQSVNPFYGGYPMMPFYDPHYFGFSPFMSFTHFSPFVLPMMANSVNPLFAGFMGQQYMSTLPNQPGHTLQDYQNSRKLSRLEQREMDAPGDLPFKLQQQLNREEDIAQDELNKQLGILSGLNKKELSDYNGIFNDMDLEVSEEEEEQHQNVI